MKKPLALKPPLLFGNHSYIIRSLQRGILDGVLKKMEQRLMLNYPDDPITNIV